DVAAAGDCNRLRQARQVEGLVGEDTVFVSGKCRVRIGAAAGGYQYVLRGDGAVLAFETDRVRVDKRGAAVKRIAAGLLDPAFVNAGEPGDLLVLVGDQGRPVEARLGHGPAIARSVGKMLRELRRSEEH